MTIEIDNFTTYPGVTDAGCLAARILADTGVMDELIDNSSYAVGVIGARKDLKVSRTAPPHAMFSQDACA